jgi:DNA-binding beta-propeller fold protein YncE
MCVNCALQFCTGCGGKSGSMAGFKLRASIFMCVGLAAVGLASACLSNAPAAGRAAGPAYLAVGGTRGPFAIAFSRDAGVACVTEFDEDSIAVMDAASGRVLDHLPSGGTQPTGVAVSADGRTAVVANSFSGSVGFIDLKTRAVQTVAQPGAPWSVVLSPQGDRAYVSVSQLDQVAVYDMATHRKIGTVACGRRPRALDISADGGTLVTANLSAGSVTYINTRDLTVKGEGPTPAVNLRGVALFPDSRTVIAVGQRAQNERPTETAVGIWSNQAFLQVPYGPRNGVQNLWLDLMGSDVADPDSCVLDARTSRVFITCSGGDSLNVLPVRGEGDTVTIKGIGAQPRGLAFTPDHKFVWVACPLSNRVAVVDTATLKVVKQLPMGKPSHPEANLQGRYLFGAASIVKGEQFSCNSCHPDGGSDGISWKFVHVPDALGKTMDRNVKGLRGHIAGQAPYRWSGRDATLNQFVTEEVTGLLQGAPLTPAQTAELVSYVGSLPITANPYREAGGKLTEEAQRGEALFMGKAGCASCHLHRKDSPPQKAWVGTTPEGVLLHPPRLEGVYDTDPYLHDGSAKTLEEIFTQHNSKHLHGKAHLLTESEMKSLLSYVKQM